MLNEAGIRSSRQVICQQYEIRKQQHKDVAKPSLSAVILGSYYCLRGLRACDVCTGSAKGEKVVFATQA